MVHFMSLEVFFGFSMALLQFCRWLTVSAQERMGRIPEEVGDTAEFVACQWPGRIQVLLPLRLRAGRGGAESASPASAQPGHDGEHGHVRVDGHGP